ncbi:MAG: hypothetical protein ACR2GU_13400 [Rubrobacteraceae bacterium]
MKRTLGGLLVIGALAGGAVAVRGYLRRSGAPGEDTVQISFGDGSTKILDSTSIEAQEFTDLAGKLLETGI